MSMLDDPEIREDFCKSSLELIGEMEDLMEQFEDDPSDCKLLEQYGLLIDRIMGTATTLEANEIGKVCELGKMIGYKSSQSADTGLNTVVAGILLDNLELLSDLFGQLENKDTKMNFNIDAFISRLTWLSTKFKHIDRQSCSLDKESSDISRTGGQKIDVNDIDALIAQLQAG